MVFDVAQFGHNRKISSVQLVPIRDGPSPCMLDGIEIKMPSRHSGGLVTKSSLLRRWPGCKLFGWLLNAVFLRSVMLLAVSQFHFGVETGSAF